MTIRVLVITPILLLAAACEKPSEDKIQEPDNTTTFSVISEPLKVIERQDYSTVVAMSFHPDGKRILVENPENEIEVYSIETEEIETVISGHENMVRDIIVADSGEFAYSSGYDNTIRKWDIATGAELGRIVSGGATNDIDLSPDGELIASAHIDGYIRIWNKDFTTEVLTIELPLAEFPEDTKEPAYTISFSPDSKSILSGNGSSVSLWSVETGALLRSFEPDTDDENTWNSSLSSVVSIAWSNDGRLISGATEFDSTYVWDASSGEQVLVLNKVHDYSKKIYDGLWEWISKVSFSPDDSKIILAETKTIRVWDSASGEELLRFETPDSNFVRAFALSPDNSILVDAAGDGASIRVWNVADLF